MNLHGGSGVMLIKADTISRDVNNGNECAVIPNPPPPPFSFPALFCHCCGLQKHSPPFRSTPCQELSLSLSLTPRLSLAPKNSDT